jgi:hypothetical protein
MQLAPTRFTKIVGTEVSVLVNSSAEAKTALKELAHKKRELNLLKRVLLRRQKAMRRRQERAKRPPSWLWSVFDPKKKLVRAVLAVADVFRPRRPPLDTAQIADELRRIDETMHAIDSCKLQIEGKLINLR